MNTFQLTCFLAVAENLNFARAAEQLHVTQPAVTQQIHSLEKELNVKLFQRTTRTVRLTEEGRVFLHDARQMVEISARAQKRFESSSDDKIRILSLGCYNFPCLFSLAGILRGLAGEFPELHPRLQVIPFQHIYRLLEEGDLDAVVGFRELDSMRVHASFREVAKVPLVCVCPREHPLARREQVRLEDLKTEKLVLFTPTKASAQLAQIQGQLMGGRPPSEFYFCESGEAATVLVSAGFGVAVLPDLFVPQGFPAARIPLEGEAPLSFGVYYKSLQGNPLLRSFIRRLQEGFEADAGRP